MNQDETHETIGPPTRPVSARRRVVTLIIAASLAGVVAWVAIPRMLDDSSKVDTRSQSDARRTQLLRALGRETAARADAEQVTRGLMFACGGTACPADLPALNRALDQDRHVPAPGDSIAWYLPHGTDYIFCVEHAAGGRPDAYALYASTVGGIVATDHGAGCMKAPADYAAAAAEVASWSGDHVPG